MHAAQNYACAMAEADRLSHTGPDGSTIADRVEAAGYGSWSVVEEALAAGPATSDAVVELWLTDPPHRAILLDPALTDFGVGFHYSSSSTFGYW
jgi:uncharacterized protein YkwD